MFGEDRFIKKTHTSKFCIHIKRKNKFVNCLFDSSIFGQMSIRSNIRLAKCLFSEMAVRSFVWPRGERWVTVGRSPQLQPVTAPMKKNIRGLIQILVRKSNVEFGAICISKPLDSKEDQIKASQKYYPWKVIKWVGANLNPRTDTSLDGSPLD